ncbi:MAG: hypothetical protein Q9197_002000 [Variospora fuerteventurae]
MPSTTEQIKTYGELVESLKTTMEALKADHSVAKTAFLLVRLEQLLSDVGKDQTATKAFEDWNQQLKAKEERLRRKDAELQQITLAASMAEESQRLQSMSKDLRSASNGFQSTSKELHSTSQDLRSLPERFKPTSENLQSSSKALKSTSTDIQSGMAKLQLTSNDLQSASETFQAIPSTLQEMHSALEILQSSSKKLQHASDTFQAIPSTSKDMHSTLEILQSSSNNLQHASEGFQEIPSTSKEMRSTLEILQSSSKGFTSQIQSLERVASDLAKTTAANTDELRRQHKEEVDGLNDTISQLQTKINDWEAGHKDRLAEFNAKRQEAFTDLDELEEYLAAKKDDILSTRIKVLEELRAADQVEARKQETLRVMSELGNKKEKIGDDVKIIKKEFENLGVQLERYTRLIQDRNASLDEWATSFDQAKMASNQQIERLRRRCTEVHADINEMDDQIKALEVRQGKLPESQHDVSLSDTIDEMSFLEEVTQSAGGKRPNHPSSTSTGPSPRKASVKRVRQSGFSPVGASPAAGPSQRSLPAPPSSTRASFPQPTRTPAGEGSRRTSRIPFPTSTPRSEQMQPPASQASSSWTSQPIPRASGKGQATISQASTEADTYETLAQFERGGSVSPTALEREEFASGPLGTQPPIGEEADVSSSPTIPDNIAGIWSQLTLDELHGHIDRARLVDLMRKAQVKPKLTAHPDRLLLDCANKTASHTEVCFTSKLRAKGVGNFEQGNNRPCKECRNIYNCLRVRWASDQAQTEVNAEKRWILERR